MSTPPLIFDRRAVLRNRIRRTDTILQRLAAEDLQDRASLVNRAFHDPAIVTTAPEIWAQAYPTAKIVADDDVLDLEAGAHDLVVHALSLHWANDPLGQLIQCRRALRPDGLLLAAGLGGETLTELRSALLEAEAQETGGAAPRVAPMAEIRDLGGLLGRAGLSLPVADSVRQTLEYPSPWHLMRDLRAMGEANALHGRLRTPTRRAVFFRAAQLYASRYATPNGRVRATFDLIFLTGWAPDPSQPQPLRPGSAATRLAEALGTREGKLPI